MDRCKRIPLINSCIIVLNIIIFLIPDILGDFVQWETLFEQGAMVPLHVFRDREYYRLFTSIFLHFDIRHLLNNMLVLFVLGERLERYMGRGRYLLFYLLCGVGANVISLMFNLRAGDLLTMSAGASGAIFGVVGGLIWAVYSNHGRLGDLSTGQMAAMALFALYLGFSSTGVDNAAHVGGLAAGILLGIPFCAWISRKRQKDI